jgi:hypothetical protein
VGRLLGGVATSLLFSAFESWVVAEHNARGFDDKLLGARAAAGGGGEGAAGGPWGLVWCGGAAGAAAGMPRSMPMRPAPTAATWPARPRPPTSPTTTHLTAHHNPPQPASPPPRAAGDVFSKAVLVGNGLMAIVSALVGNVLVEDLGLGRVAPFDAAVAVLGIGAAIILVRGRGGAQMRCVLLRCAAAGRAVLGGCWPGWW